MFRFFKALFASSVDTKDRDSTTFKNSSHRILRMGKNIDADEAFFAWTSGDLDRMILASRIETNPIDRHFLLIGIIQGCYRRRGEQGMADLCKHYGEIHLSEFNDILDSLKIEMNGTIPRIPTFQCLSTIYTEEGNYARAFEVCDTAIMYGLKDGTKGGFDGRKDRIKKIAEKIK